MTFHSNHRRLTNGFIFLIAMVVFTGCSNGPRTADAVSSGRLNVVCTTNIVRDLVQQVGGEFVSATAIMEGPGLDPHTYSPSPADSNLLTAADVVVYCGLHLEAQMDDALKSLSLRGIPVICLTDGLQDQQPSQLIRSEEGLPDPHVWFDPVVWSDCGKYFAKELSRLKPQQAEQVQQQALDFETSLANAQRECEDLIAKVPPDQRTLVTAHDAFAYFARRFRFQVQAVQGISTESEPGLKGINRLVDLLVQKKISAVFTEQSVSDRNIQALVSGCDARGHRLEIGGKLYSDTIGHPDGPEGTIQKALVSNVRKIVSGLIPSDSDRKAGQANREGKVSETNQIGLAVAEQGSR